MSVTFSKGDIKIKFDHDGFCYHIISGLGLSTLRDDAAIKAVIQCAERNAALQGKMRISRV